MNDFRISLDDLCHGWATITFENNEQEVIHTFSHITVDALSCLVYSAMAIMRNEPYHARFYLEPDDILYEATPHEGKVDILIGNKPFSCDVKRYARQILTMFAYYLSSHSIDEYVAQWHYDYPKNAIEQLRNQLKEHT